MSRLTSRFRLGADLPAMAWRSLTCPAGTGKYWQRTLPSAWKSAVACFQPSCASAVRPLARARLASRSYQRSNTKGVTTVRARDRGARSWSRQQSAHMLLRTSTAEAYKDSMALAVQSSISSRQDTRSAHKHLPRWPLSKTRRLTMPSSRRRLPQRNNTEPVSMQWPRTSMPST